MIKERLTELREAADMTKKELAALLKCAPSTVSSYERGNSEPDNTMLAKIAIFFNVSTDYLLGTVEEMIPLVREDAIDLPKGFPKDSVSKVNEYIRLLMIDHKAKG